MAIQWLSVLGLAVITVTSGCALPWTLSATPNSGETNASGNANTADSPVDSEQELSGETVTADEVLAGRLRQLGSELDPESSRQLAADLQSMEPALWPFLLGFYEARRTSGEAKPAALTEKQTASADSPSLPTDSVLTVSAANESNGSDGEREEKDEKESIHRHAANTTRLDAPDEESGGDVLNRLATSQPGLPPHLLVQQLLANPARGMSSQNYEASHALAASQTDWHDLLQSQLAKESAKATDKKIASQSALDGHRSGRVLPVAYEQSVTAKHQRQTDEPLVQSIAATDQELPWQYHLDRSIEQLEKQVALVDDPASKRILDLRLRLLYVSSGRVQDALGPLSAVDTKEQQFWTSELFGLAALLDEERMPDENLRATYAGRELRRAITRLGEIGALDVRNLACCRSVESWGIYEKLNVASDIFRGGEEILLYAELENFVSHQVEDGFRTTLDARYEIRNDSGQRISHGDFEELTEICRNYRRDFFVHYRIRLPKDIAPGHYTLHLFIKDVLGNKEGESYLPFSVAGESGLQRTARRDS